MRWEMEMEEVEAVLETIWDLHDKISDAILSISRSHFLNSIRTKSTLSTETAKTMRTTKRNLFFDSNDDDDNNNKNNGFVFVKDFRDDDDDVVDVAAMAEARSLNAIRTALENLEDQLEFFHIVGCEHVRKARKSEIWRCVSMLEKLESLRFGSRSARQKPVHAGIQMRFQELRAT